MRLILGTALVASAALAACGGDGDGDVVEKKGSGRAGAAGASGKAGGAGTSGTAGAAAGIGGATAGGAGAGATSAGASGSAGANAGSAGVAGASATGGAAGATAGAAGEAGAGTGGSSAGQSGQSGAGGQTSGGAAGTGGGAAGDAGQGGNAGQGGKGVGGKIEFGGFGGKGEAGSANGGAGGGVSALTQACAAYATARCEKAKTCIADEPKRLYGPQGDADCVQLTTAACEDRANAAQSNVTPSDVQACATATNAATCSAFRATPPLPACATVAGKAANDTPCVFDETCASKYCKKALTAGCGVCAAAPVSGADCTTFSCGTGNLVCKQNDKPSGPARTCQPAGGPGQCDADDDCAVGSYCPPAGFGIRTCKASGGSNAQCDPTEQGSCDAGLGLSCKAGTGFPAQNRCVANELANPGAACGPGAGGNKICGGASACIGGKCVPHTVEGMTCDPTAGPACLLGYQCVAGQFGVKSCVDLGKQVCP